MHMVKKQKPSKAKRNSHPDKHPPPPEDLEIQVAAMLLARDRKRQAQERRVELVSQAAAR